MSVRVFAPAKINLTLKVGRPNANGRHPLQSVVTFADVGDWIEAAPADEISLRAVSGPFAAALEDERDNLVLRAARTLAAATGARKGAMLSLHKTLPVASGVGGGSSDAAATLKALNALWGLALSEGDLMRIAAPLGGDVPVCVLGRAAYMAGEGEQAAPMALPTLDAVLVNPGFAVSTAGVFAAFDALGLGAGFQTAPMPDWLTCDAALAGMRALGNDLFAAAQAVAPQLSDIDAMLRQAPDVRFVGLSGSGATMFALVGDANAAARIANSLSAAHPTWWIRAVRLGALDAGAGEG